MKARVTPDAPSLRILVDTNVWLDNYLSFRPHSAESRAFLEHACSQDAEILYPIHCLKDVFFLIQAQLKQQLRQEDNMSEEKALEIREIAWKCIGNLRELAVAVGADEADSWQCSKRKTAIPDLEDSLVVASAERAQADFLVTNDVQLIKLSTVPAHTPADALALMSC